MMIDGGDSKVNLRETNLFEIEFERFKNINKK